MVRTLLPTQAATSLPRLTPSSHQALNPPHTSTPTSDWYTWVTVGWNGAVGCGFIGKSGACREICCWEQPFALDSPSNHQSQLGGGGEKKKKKKTSLDSLEHQVSARHETVPKVPASAVTAKPTSDSLTFFFFFKLTFKKKKKTFNNLCFTLKHWDFS